MLNKTIRVCKNNINNKNSKFQIKKEVKVYRNNIKKVMVCLILQFVKIIKIVILLMRTNSNNYYKM